MTAPAVPVEAPPAARAAARPRRADFIDAARGTAMLLVFLTHFAWIYFEGRGEDRLQGALLLVGQIASPTFMGISGLMLGFLHHTRPERFAAFRVKLVDRALVLLTAVHVLETLAYLPMVGTVREAMRWAPITDAIGVCLLLGPFLVGRMAPAARVATGAALLAASWALAAAWQPEATWLRYAKETLVGATGERAYGYNFPIAPWFGFYFAATALGEWLGAAFHRDDARAIVRRLLALAAAGVMSGIAVKVAYELACRLLDRRPLFGPLSHMLLSPFQKWPPAPFYFLFYGGIGCAILVGCYLLERHGRWTGYLAFVRMLGRVSLFVFVLQDWVYVAGLHALRPPLTPLWPLLFLATVALIGAASWAWYRLDGNRLLTVGYGRSWGPRGVPGGADA
jgi:uncharacterized membrane protein